MTDQTTQSPTLASVIRIDSIILRELSWSMPEIGIAPGLPIQLNSTFSFQIGNADGELLYRVRGMVVGAVDLEGEPTMIFELSAVLQAVFTYPGEYSFAAEEFQFFGETSILPMLYPYFRQIVSSTTSQAGFVGVILPPLPYAGKFERIVPADNDVPQ